MRMQSVMPRYSSERSVVPCTGIAKQRPHREFAATAVACIRLLKWVEISEDRNLLNWHCATYLRKF